MESINIYELHPEIPLLFLSCLKAYVGDVEFHRILELYGETKRILEIQRNNGEF